MSVWFEGWFCYGEVIDYDEWIYEVVKILVVEVECGEICVDFYWVFVNGVGDVGRGCCEGWFYCLILLVLL